MLESLKESAPVPKPFSIDPDDQPDNQEDCSEEEASAPVEEISIKPTSLQRRPVARPLAKSTEPEPAEQHEGYQPGSFMKAKTQFVRAIRAEQQDLTYKQALDKWMVSEERTSLLENVPDLKRRRFA